MRLIRVIVLAVAWLLASLRPAVAQEVDSRLLDSLLVSGSAVRGAVESSSPLQRLSSSDLVRLGNSIYFSNCMLTSCCSNVGCLYGF